jgi:hypothetical protein
MSEELRRLREGMGRQGVRRVERCIQFREKGRRRKG